MQAPPTHWKERAIAKAEGITDAWEVAKTYAARIAEWILFFCMIANIIEILPGVTFWIWLSDTILGVQAITLDIAGFGLASMADHAAARGDTNAANSAKVTSWFLIGLMLVTLVNVSVGILFPFTLEYTLMIDKGLILARVGMMVVYGHVVHGLRSSHTVRQQAQQDLRAENEALTTTVTTLQQQIESHQHRATLMQKQLDNAQQEISRLQTALTDEQERSSTLKKEWETGQGDTATLRRQLNTTSIETETLKAQLEGKDRELESLRETLMGNQEFQESRVQQLLSSEQKQVERLRQQLEAEQEGTIALRQQLNATNLQVVDLTARLEAANLQVKKLQNEAHDSTKMTELLDQKCRELERVNADLRTAKTQISELQKAKTQTPKKDNITPIETAKSSRISHAEVLAYMAANPDLKRTEVAAQLKISERKVYDALAWGKGQENAASTDPSLHFADGK